MDTVSKTSTPVGKLRPWLWRGVKLLLAMAILTSLYAAADWKAVGHALQSLDGRWLLAALAMFIPQTLVSAWRWQGLASGVTRITWLQATRHTLAASALNLVVPSKLGDLSKAAMLPGSPSVRRTAPLVILEKGSDVAALLILLAMGWLGVGIRLLGPVLVVAAMASIWGSRNRCPAAVAASLEPGHGSQQARRLSRLAAALDVRRAVALAGSSLVLWMLHLVQFDLLLRAAGVQVTTTDVLARIPLAIFAGLLPLTMWGVGTRDSALVWLFADVAAASTMAGVGLLTALRYLIPGVVGLPCLHGLWPARVRLDHGRSPVYRIGNSKQAA